MKKRVSKPKPAIGVFGQLVRKYREQFQITMMDLARAADIDQGLLSKIERGKRPPPQIVPTVQRIAEKFGFDPRSSEYQQLLHLAYRERIGKEPPRGGYSIYSVGLAASGGRSAPAVGLGSLPPISLPVTEAGPPPGGVQPVEEEPISMLQWAHYICAALGIGIELANFHEQVEVLELVFRLPSGRQYRAVVSPNVTKGDQG